jgi:hypothetical protein
MELRFAAPKLDELNLIKGLTWEPLACAELAGVPRVFLKTVLSGCVEAAKKQGVAVITPEFLHRLRDKHPADRPPSLLAKVEQFFGHLRS